MASGRCCSYTGVHLTWLRLGPYEPERSGPLRLGALRTRRSRKVIVPKGAGISDVVERGTSAWHSLLNGKLAPSNLRLSRVAVYGKSVKAVAEDMQPGGPQS